MYRNAYQRGMLTIFFSGGSKPLAIWDVHTQDGYVSRFLDQDIKSMVLEIGGTNVSTTYMTCPKGKVVLGITMPFLVMIVKNLKKYFSFEVTILDETSTRRRFRVSNFQSTTQILPLCTAMPIGLSDGWNQIQFNLAEFTRRAYKKQFVEVQKLKINANIRIRRIYFTERLLPEDELPPEYKLYFPLSSKDTKDKRTLTKGTKEEEPIKQSASQPEVKASEAISEEKPKSEINVLKPASKTSVHSIKKVSSQESRKLSKENIETIPEGEATTEVTDTEALEGVSEKAETTEEQPPVEDTNLEIGDDAVEQSAEAKDEGPEEPADQGPEEPKDHEQPPTEVFEAEPPIAPEAEPVTETQAEVS